MMTSRTELELSQLQAKHYLCQHQEAAFRHVLLEHQDCREREEQLVHELQSTHADCQLSEQQN